MISLDGSYLEGGGQILRTAVGMSALTGKACRIYNIRANRSNPGLRPQHLKGIEAVADVCEGKIQGGKVGSSEVTFIPGEITAQNLEIDIQTAGSITLLAQALFLPTMIMRDKVTYTIQGGTHVAWSPPFEFFKHVFCHYLNRLGIHVNVAIDRYGFYPKGGGQVKIDIRLPDKLSPLQLVSTSDNFETEAWSVATLDLQKREVAKRQLDAASDLLNIKTQNIRYADSYSTGSSIVLCTQSGINRWGSSALGVKGISAEKVGTSAAREMLDNRGLCKTRDFGQSRMLSG